MQRSGEDVASFLRANPGWLAAHPEIYAVLEPPRRLHGERLADHMAAMLALARRHGDDTAAGRRAAEGFTQLVQAAVLALMRSPDARWCVEHDWPGLLRVAGVRLCPEPGVAEAVLGQRVALVRAAGADRALLEALHGEVAALVRVEALVRVPGAGLLALAGREADRFEGATTPSLAFLGEAVAAALERR